MYDDPLNQAALTRLRKERLPQSEGLPVLDLVACGLPLDPLDDDRQLLEEFNRPGNRKYCLQRLQEIEPERILTEPLPDLADGVMSLLR